VPLQVKLIVGLGNPGEQYQKTRHNAGFLFLDRLCQQAGAHLKLEKHCFGRLAQVTIEGQTIRLLAPETFMNLSGKAVVAALSYYKIALNETLIVHDELDLDPGTVRLKSGGGHGGNNGLHFNRLRIGIGHPGVGRDVAAYVLKQANKDQQNNIDDAIDEALHVLPDIVAGNMQAAMNQLHTKK